MLITDFSDRAHHRYTDTDKDPYSVRKGLLYSHFGWMVMKQNPKRIGRTVSELRSIYFSYLVRC